MAQKKKKKIKLAKMVAKEKKILVRPLHNAHINCWILPLIELDLYFLDTYLCIKYESNTLFKRHPTKNHFSKLKKGRNSHNNWWTLAQIELDLYFMIIYLCITYESNILIFSKDTERKPFFLKLKKGHNSHHD